MISPPMDCYACDNEATRQCRRCARVYCEVHGGDLCGECLNPASALPSFNLYRGSLLILLVGTAVAIWLLVRPAGSGESGGPQIGILNVTPTPIVTQEPVGTPTPELTGTPDGTTTPGTTTPGTTTPGGTETPEDGTPGPQLYTVQAGDTLSGIAERFVPDGVDVFDYAQQIADASGLSSVDEPLTPGQRLVLP